MNRKSIAYSVVLLLSLIFTSVVLNRDVVRGLTSNSDVTLSVASGGTHVLGQDIVFSGSLVLASSEQASISGVRLLNTSGQQALDVDLPLSDTGGAYVDLSANTASTADSLFVKVTFTDVTALGGTLPNGSLPGSLPNTTLPEGDNVSVSVSGGQIEYEVIWTPPVNLDPVPDLTLIPEYDVYYDIPTISPPSAISGTTLPATDLAWSVPTAGQTSGTELPDVTSTVAIPQITLSTNAPTWAPDLPATTATSTGGFTIPSQTAATSSAANFPEVTNIFAIPTVSVATSAISDFGADSDLQFIVPGTTGATSSASVIKGMTHDGEDFWFILAGASNDFLLKVLDENQTGTGLANAAYASSTLPSNDFEGVAYAGGALWLVEKKHRCYDDIENSMADGGCNYNSRVFKIDPTDLPTASTESAWAKTSSSATTKVDDIFHFGEEWDGLTGITAGDSGSLWIQDEWGNRFRNVSAAGIELADYEGEWVQSDAVAYNSNLLYTSNGSTITQWTDGGNKITDFDTGRNNIKSVTFNDDVMYFTSNANGTVYASFVGATVNQDQPKGVAYSASGNETALWIVLNGSPKDKILKVDSSAGTLITNFSTDGIHDAPSDAVEGITYLDSALYVIANEGSGWDKQRKLYKINATTGKTESGYPKDLGNFVWDDLGGITNDGTNIVSWTKSSFNDVKVFDTQGQEVSSYWPCCPSWNGSKGLAYHSGRQEYFVSSGTELSIFDSSLNNIVSDHSISLSSSDTSAPSVTFASSEGAVFASDDLFMVSGAQVYQSFLAASVTTKPLGIGWSADSAPGLGGTESVWVLIDAAPFDKIMRINTSDGSLNTSFDTDGVADAPSGTTEGVVFITEGQENFLYIVANDPGMDAWNKKKNLYKYNVKTGLVASGYPKNLQDTAMMWDDVGGITYNGTNLIVSAKTNNGTWEVDTDGNKVAEGWPCCSSLFGMTAVAYHETRGIMYGANQGKLVTISSNLMDINTEESATATYSPSGSSAATINGIQGMTFAQDMLFVARYESSQGYVSSGALKESLTTKPTAMVISPTDAVYTGQQIGEALWVVVDGSPKDRVLKLDMSTNGTTTPDTDFGSDTTKNGSAELPAANIKGLAFLDNALYAIGDSGYEPTLYKLNPVTGAILDTYNLGGGNMMGGHMGGGGGGGGMMIHDAVGGMAQNATQMIVFAQNNDQMWWVSTSGSVEKDKGLPMSNMGSGADASAYITADNTYWTAKQDSVQMWLNPFGDDIFPAGNPHSISAVQNIKGLAVKQSSKEIFIAWNDGTDGYYSIAVPPSPITNTPLDVAYNADNNELYILVDGEGGDVVVAVNPSTGAILTDADGADRFGTVNSEDAYSVAYHNGSVYVAYEERSQGGGHHGQPQMVISKRETSTLDEIGYPSNIDSNCGTIRGMSSDGTSLLVTVSHCGPKLETINAESGQRIQEVYFWTKGGGGWHEEGFEDVAYSTNTPMYFVVKGGSVYQISDSGERIAEWSVTDPDGAGTNNLTGIDFVQTTTGQVLYVADASAKKVYQTLVPLPTINITNQPLALATDGQSTFVAVEATPVDKIIRMAVSTTSASVISSFDSPFAATAGLAILDGELWVLNNETHNIEQPGGGVMQMTVSTLGKLNTSTGEQIFFSPIIVNTNYGPDILKDLVSGLATDGQKLYTASNGERTVQVPGRMYVIDPNNVQQLCMFGKCFSAPVAEHTNTFAGSLASINSVQGIEIAPSGVFADGRRIVTSGGENYGGVSNRISRLDIEVFSTPQGGSYPDSVMFDQKVLGTHADLTLPPDIKGIAIAGTVLYMADYANGKLIGTALPENTGVEMTIVGSYGVSLSATTDGGTYSSSATYDIERNTDVRVQITSPTNNFVATSSSATIAGRVSDPAVTSVSVGIQLPETSFIDDEVDTEGVSAGLWTAAVTEGNGSVTWAIDSSGACPDCDGAAWRFANSGTGSFDQTNSQVAGTLTSNEVLPVNQGTVLSFETAWDTEFQPEMDQKFVQIAEVTTDLQGNDTYAEADFKNIGQIVQFVDPMFMPMPVNPHESLFMWLQAPPLPFSANQQHKISIDLSPLAGKRIKVRFAFDSIDEFANEGRGWFIDDIEFKGSGTKTINVSTTKLNPAVQVPYGTTTVTMYRSFSTLFTLAEGENTVIATAVQPYGPSLRGSNQTQGFVDTKDPVITLFNIPENTNNVQQQLKGTLVEPTIDKGGMLEIAHNVTSPSGATSTAIVGKVTTEGEFTVFVSLQEGTNTFVATARDGGGRSAVEQIVSIADLSPPVAQVAVVGVTSLDEALVGDQYFIVVGATDALSGVATSTIVSTGAVMPAMSAVPSILTEMHGLGAIGTTTVTHASLASVQAGTPVGVNSIEVSVSDKAGNTVNVSGQLNVVSSRSNRNYFMFPGNNFMGLALIPDDGDSETTDDASLDRLMTQDISDSVSSAFKTHMGTSTIVLGDVVASTFAFNKAGNFIVHTPGAAADTLTVMAPFQGMNVNTKETVSDGAVEVFKKVSVAGFSAQQAVPIRINIEGVFFRQGELPPDKEMRVGYNLIAPHILGDTTFDTVYRGALVPRELAVSALSFDRRVDASSSAGSISAEIIEGFVTNSIGDSLKAELSYWTFIADDPLDTRVNSLGDPLGPTITP